MKGEGREGVHGRRGRTLRTSQAWPCRASNSWNKLVMAGQRTDSGDLRGEEEKRGVGIIIGGLRWLLNWEGRKWERKTGSVCMCVCGGGCRI